MENKGDESTDQLRAKSLVIVFSYHHNNTEKIANAVAKVLGAEVKTPPQVKPDEIAEYDVVGFGSGIYGLTFDASVLDLVDRLPESTGKKAFLFSTYGAPAFAVHPGFMENNHREVRNKLRAKGFVVIGEFGCAGWNTNSFLAYFGGNNKGRPDVSDLKNAETFARGMMEKAGMRV